MKCPIDEETLVIAERQGVEIDYCPRCRGVWLDRGELDKLIDKEEARYESGPVRRDRDRDDDDDYKRHSYNPKRKKKGLLSEMFEFGD